MNDISAKIKSLKEQLPLSVKLVAVSKTKPVEDIMAAYNSGQRCFGENRVQEILRKKVLLPADIEWHFIGHLQTNKVKLLVPFVNLIESVDSFRLLKTLNSEALNINKQVNCLLQLHIAKEETKFGFSMEEISEMIHSTEFSGLYNVRICGVMGMATFTDDAAEVRKEFSYLANCFKELKLGYFKGNEYFKEISMGMSGDFSIAVEEGSTIVRIGSLIFGERK